MARYRMDDGTVVDTDNAKRSFAEDTYWDGNNHVSRATGTQWDHQRLYESRKGRYYVERTSQWQGVRPGCEWVSNEEAARWLLANDYDADEMPEALATLVDDVSE